MENIELYKKEVKGKITEIIVNDESLDIVFEGGHKIEVYTDHQNDCCERVYGDFSVVKFHKDSLIDKECTSIVFKGVVEMGFLVCFYFGLRESEKIFIPCYNVQNGYYSSDLTLVIKEGEVETKINIHEYVEDRID